MSAQANTHRSDLKFAKCIFCIIVSLALRYIPFFIFGTIVSLAKDTVSKEIYAGFTIALFWSIELVFFGAFANVVLILYLTASCDNFLS